MQGASIPAGVPLASGSVVDKPIKPARSSKVQGDKSEENKKEDPVVVDIVQINLKPQPGAVKPRETKTPGVSSQSRSAQRSHPAGRANQAAEKPEEHGRTSQPQRSRSAQGFRPSPNRLSRPQAGSQFLGTNPFTEWFRQSRVPAATRNRVRVVRPVRNRQVPTNAQRRRTAAPPTELPPKTQQHSDKPAEVPKSKVKPEAKPKKSEKPVEEPKPVTAVRVPDTKHGATRVPGAGQQLTPAQLRAKLRAEVQARRLSRDQRLRASRRQERRRL